MSGERRMAPATRWRQFPHDPDWQAALKHVSWSAGLIDWLCDQRQLAETKWVETWTEPARPAVDTRSVWRKLYDLPVWAWVLIVIALAMLVRVL